MRQAVASTLALAAALCAGPARAEPTDYDAAFVKEFEDACVPGRLGYELSQDAATAAGWATTSRDSHPELDPLLTLGETAARDPEFPVTFDFAVFGKQIDEQPHFLVISRTVSEMGVGEAPFVQVGCHLYNLDATTPVSPEPVTALIGKPIASTQEQGGAISHVWGPGCTMPRTFDTYLSFVAEGSEMSAQFPFTGAALNFTTSTPEPDEVVPATYC